MHPVKSFRFRKAEFSNQNNKSNLFVGELSHSDLSEIVVSLRGHFSRENLYSGLIISPTKISLFLWQFCVNKFIDNILLLINWQ